MISRSWWKARIALQILAEERAGAPRRALEAAETAGEDAAFDEAQQVMGRAR